MLLFLTCYKNSLSYGVNILLGQPVYTIQSMQPPIPRPKALYALLITNKCIVLPWEMGSDVCTTKWKRSMCISNDIQTTFFYFGRLLKKLADDQCSSITKDSICHITHNVHTTFYHGSGLSWNCTFNGSICFVWYLHILRFYYVKI